MDCGTAAMQNCFAMKKEKPCDLEIATIPGFPDYTFTSDGRVFKNGVPKIVSCKKGRSAKVVIRLNYKMYTLGLARLIAEQFIPNPWRYKRVIFKDRNHHNCTKDNIAWVDEETYFYYCCPDYKRGIGRKILHTQEYAVENTRDPELKRYYMTLDEYWRDEAWNKVDQEMSDFNFWPQVKSEVYLRFIDRVERFSILDNPAPLMWHYAKWEWVKLKKQISPHLPTKKLRQIDESLRNMRQID
jgi:hypothetical protein